MRCVFFTNGHGDNANNNAHGTVGCSPWYELKKRPPAWLKPAQSQLGRNKKKYQHKPTSFFRKQKNIYKHPQKSFKKKTWNWVFNLSFFKNVIEYPQFVMKSFLSPHVPTLIRWTRRSSCAKAARLVSTSSFSCLKEFPKTEEFLGFSNQPTREVGRWILIINQWDINHHKLGYEQNNFWNISLRSYSAIIAWDVMGRDLFLTML